MVGYPTALGQTTKGRAAPGPPTFNAAFRCGIKAINLVRTNIMRFCPAHTKQRRAKKPDGVSGCPFTKPGFITREQGGRLWVFKLEQSRPTSAYGILTVEKSEKHVTLVGAGPGHRTVKALDRTTALEYIASKPGFRVEIKDNRLWVLRPGQEKSEKHVTLVGRGPLGMTIKALDKNTAIEYLATKPGFEVEADENGRIWIFRSGQPKEKSEKHITRVVAGTHGATIKALDRRKYPVNACRRPLQRSIFSRTRDSRRLETSPTSAGASICTSTKRSLNTYGSSNVRKIHSSRALTLCCYHFNVRILLNSAKLRARKCYRAKSDRLSNDMLMCSGYRSLGSYIADALGERAS